MDWSPTPDLEFHQNLIFNECWVESSVTLDKDGKAEISAFYGNYSVTDGAWETHVSLKKEKGQIKIEVGK